jgi:hypothetical protein
MPIILSIFQEGRKTVDSEWIAVPVVLEISSKETFKFQHFNAKNSRRFSLWPAAPSRWVQFWLLADPQRAKVPDPLRIRLMHVQPHDSNYLIVLTELELGPAVSILPSISHLLSSRDAGRCYLDSPINRSIQDPLTLAPAILASWASWIAALRSWRSAQVFGLPDQALCDRLPRDS